MNIKDPQARTAFVFGEPTKACPKCKGWNIGYSTPIKLNAPLPGDARGILKAWAMARKSGATLLEGTACIMCRDCGHCGPTVDVTGRTAEDVGRDPHVASECKRLWNSEENR